jgi:hypothetical protein
MEGVSMNPMIKPYTDLYANIAPIASPKGRVIKGMPVPNK